MVLAVVCNNLLCRAKERRELLELLVEIIFFILQVEVSLVLELPLIELVPLFHREIELLAAADCFE